MTAIHMIAFLLLIGRAGAYETGSISGSEFAVSAVICLAGMAAGILIDRAREARKQEDSNKEEVKKSA